MGSNDCALSQVDGPTHYVATPPEATARQLGSTVLRHALLQSRMRLVVVPASEWHAQGKGGVGADGQGEGGIGAGTKRLAWLQRLLDQVLT